MRQAPLPPVLLAALAMTLTACAARRPSQEFSTQAGLPRGVEAISLLGDTLRAPELPAATREQYEQRLASARADLEREPGSADALIWVGRRTAYLGRYREAIDIFSRGVQQHPADARMYRHRGHRWITVRELDRAISDFNRAADLTRGRPDEVEPDGLPNERGIPTSTLQSNIWYHLGLAHYLKADWSRALAAYDQAVRVSTNDDMRVATAYWRYLALRRMAGDADAQAVLAAITPALDVHENTAYHRLLLLFRGDLEVTGVAGEEAGSLEDVTTAYGIAMWHQLSGRPDEARATLRRIADTGAWAAFGYIAAEAELARGGPAGTSR